MYLYIQQHIFENNHESFDNQMGLNRIEWFIMMYKENNRNQIESVSTIYIPFCHY